MEPLKGFLKVPKPVQSRRSERGDVMDKILGKLNPARVEKGYPPLTHGRLARLLKGISKSQVYHLIACAEEAERRAIKDPRSAFSKYFWYAIRQKKEGPNH